MNLVSAVLLMCMLNGQCQQTAVRIEKRMCQTSARGQIHQDGEWIDATFRISCRK